MQEVTDVVLSFIDRCESHKKLPDLIDDFSKSLKKLGFDHFMMTRLPAMNERDAEAHVIAHDWSVAWLDQYRAQEYFWSDPVSLFSFGFGKAFTWAEARKSSASTKKALQIASEAKSIGMTDGMGFPMGDMAAVQAVVSISSNHIVDLPPSGKALLHLMCTSCETRATEILYDPKTVRPLTQKECEVLRWIANGKSAQDTADILGISSQTIAIHLGHAREKLNTSNTAHAIARGLMTRQFIL